IATKTKKGRKTAGISCGQLLTIEKTQCSKRQWTDFAAARARVSSRLAGLVTTPLGDPNRRMGFSPPQNRVTVAMAG
ncbi:hypothetical protein HMPREF9080_02288, partial [Cardiobacterium valvarum F0432]